MSFTEAEILSLIELVKCELSLYDKSKAECRDRAKINATFSKIGRKLNKGANEVKSLWLNLTKTYAWLVQNKNYESGETCWPYLEAMSFLKPFVKDYKLVDVVNGERLINYEASLEAGIPVPVFCNEKSVFCGENNPFILDSSIKQDVDLMEDTVLDDVSQISTRTPSPNFSSNCVLKKSFEVEDALCQYLKKKISKQKDPNELFLISVAHDMKMLSPQDQAVFKMKVQQLLVEMINKSNLSTKKC